MIIKRFLNWKTTADVRKRSAAASALARAYLTSELAFEDRVAAEAALAELCDDPSPHVRMAMADALAGSGHAPDHVINALLCDRYDIASLIVVRSPIVRETDLADRVRQGDPRLQPLMASRSHVGRLLALALARYGTAEAAIALLDNSTAHVCNETLRLLVDRHATTPDVRARLLESSELPAVFRYRLLLAAGEACQDAKALVAYALSEERAGDIIGAAIQRSVIELVAQASVDELPELTQTLCDDGRLTTVLLVRSVCCGHVDFIVAAVALLTTMSRGDVASVFAGSREAPLRALLSRAGLAEHTHVIFTRAIAQWAAVARGRLDAGVQEVTHAVMEAYDASAQASRRPANDDLRGLLRGIYLDAVRTNARSHARAVAAMDVDIAA
ncbi:MAG: DUF2336 domain-containing protein [Pseudomonadota bacterium]